MIHVKDLNKLYIPKFVGGQWSREPLCRSCVHFGWCCATGFVMLGGGKGK